MKEEQHLREIYVDEQFGPPAPEVEKQKEEKKKYDNFTNIREWKPCQCYQFIFWNLNLN